MTLRPGECVACGAGRFRWDTPDGHQPFCAAVKAKWERDAYEVSLDPVACAFDEGCAIGGHWSRGMCKNHYERWRVANVRARAAA